MEFRPIVRLLGLLGAVDIPNCHHTCRGCGAALIAMVQRGAHPQRQSRPPTQSRTCPAIFFGVFSARGCLMYLAFSCWPPDADDRSLARLRRHSPCHRCCVNSRFPACGLSFRWKSGAELAPCPDRTPPGPPRCLRFGNAGRPLLHHGVRHLPALRFEPAAQQGSPGAWWQCRPL